MNRYRFTIFTPTFNRGYIITELYKSLQKQTFTNFEWLVVDDGSEDNTEEIFQKIELDNKFSVKYIKKENGGQHTALNLAINHAEGELFFMVDSDDFLREDALELLDYYEKTITEKNKYAGVAGLRKYHNGDVIGDKWSTKKKYIDATNFERKEKKLLGDKAEAYYTHILKRFLPIPVFEGENDVEKGLIWNRIANENLKIRWFNEGIYYCEYLPDGLTVNMLDNYKKNYLGYSIFVKEIMHYKKVPFMTKLKMLILYCNISHMKNISFSDISKNLEMNKIILLIPFLYSKVMTLAE